MFYHKKTKVVATIGPATESAEMMQKLMEAGANVFRFNMKHNTHDWHVERIDRAIEVAAKMGGHIGILIDLQGSEVRIRTPRHEVVTLTKGTEVYVSDDKEESDTDITLSHPQVIHSLKVDDIVLVDDGFNEFKVSKKKDNGVMLEAVEDCVIGHYKGLNFPGIDIDIPSLTEDDFEKLNKVAKTRIDFVGLSFARTKKDVDALRGEMKKRGVEAAIISKIESQKALDSIDELIAESDGIMVARGDLGIEVPFEQLAYWQKEIILKCRKAGKYVITATQMLQSMIDSPRPTRAEATDVSNAIYDGTDAIMLSGESAFGKFPVKAVQAMSKIAAFSESKSRLHDLESPPQNVAELVVHAAMAMIDDKDHPKVDAVLVFTETGWTARQIARFRPNRPIIAVTNNQKAHTQLSVVYGIHAVYARFPEGVFTMKSAPNPVFEKLKKEKIIVRGEKVLITHGQFWQTPGATNTVAIITVD